MCTLLFVFFSKTQGKTSKIHGIFFPAKALKCSEESEKRTRKDKEHLRREGKKEQEIQQRKERKDRECARYHYRTTSPRARSLPSCLADIDSPRIISYFPAYYGKAAKCQAKICSRKRPPKSELGRCPSTVRPVFPVLVFQLSKQQNRTRTTSSTVLGTPPNRTRTERFPPKKCFEAVAFLVGFSTRNFPPTWHFHSLEPYTKPYLDTS